VCLHGGPGLWDYLAPLAALLDDTFTVVRFDQRGCGRSTGHDGPFTIKQAVDDLDQVRAALGFSRWAAAGHSWGAELALRYAARHQDRTTAVAYVAGVGAGNGFKDAYVAELDCRLGHDRERWAALSAIPAGDLTPAEERELCLLQWRTDFSPTPDAAGHALVRYCRMALLSQRICPQMSFVRSGLQSLPRQRPFLPLAAAAAANRNVSGRRYRLADKGFRLVAIESRCATGKVTVIMSLSRFSNEYDPDAVGVPWSIDEFGERSGWEEDDESPYAEIIARITEAKAHGSGWPGWSLDWSRPGLVIITTPSGRSYASTPEGDPAAMPADMQQPHRRVPNG
jgi:pimeloyl-ACP methyl ester carboxylesterase